MLFVDKSELIYIDKSGDLMPDINSIGHINYFFTSTTGSKRCCMVGSLQIHPSEV